MKVENRYDSLIQYYAELNQFTGQDWLRFKAQIKAESNFDPNAKSSVGALGLMQFMPATWAEWQDGTPGLQEQVAKLQLVDPRDPEDAISSGIVYMKWLLRRLTTWERAWAGYNWGIGRVLKLPDNVPWKTLLPVETRNYIFKIDGFYEQYRKSTL